MTMNPLPPPSLPLSLPLSLSLLLGGELSPDVTHQSFGESVGHLLRDLWVDLLDLFEHMHLWDLIFLHDRECDPGRVLRGVVESVGGGDIVARVERVVQEQTIVRVDRESWIVR
jgi:hypothetical protein